MFNSVRTLGDWLLGRLMPETEAGACVSFAGHSCTIAGHYGCTGICSAG